MKSLNIDWVNEIDNFKEDYFELGFEYGPNADEFFVSFRERNGLDLDHDPFKQIDTYKNLLLKLKGKYPDEYKQIHKGTPFFWIGWYSFLIENYDQAIFYIDAAMSEDKINHPREKWLGSGAALFFRLKLADYQTLFDSNAPELNVILEKEFNRFKPLNLKNNLKIENFVENFVEEIIKNDENTAIITTLYTFILEKNRIMEMIHDKGEHGGTIEPMIMHIFKGGLIFDTLLKKQHGGKTLGNTLENCKTRYSFDFNQCTPNSFNDIFNYENKNNKQTAFCITYKLRNNAAHKLDWHESFNESNYEKVYQNILNAIFFVIQEEYL